MRIPGTSFTDEGNPVPAKNFCQTLLANVDNKKLSDKAFRTFVRNTLPVVDFPRPDPPPLQKKMKARKEPEFQKMKWWDGTEVNAD